VSVQDVNPPESPRIVDAEIAVEPASGRECLLARDEEGRELAFVFELESDAPGVSLVDPAAWRAAAGAPEDSPQRFEAVREPRADDWLPSIVAHPVGAEWLRHVEDQDPAAYHAWFAQTQYESGGEQGSG
jgi:hypothetical protein